MNDLLIRDLLHEVADHLEPGDRLDAIRAATASSGRRPHRGWWVAGGAGLVAASVVTAFALTTGGAPQTNDPDVAGGASTSTTPTPTTTATDAPVRGSTVAVYFVGHTSRGPRLFREFRPRTTPDRPWLFALNAAVKGNALDADYGSTWPTSASVHGWEEGTDGIAVSVRGVTRERPAGMSEEDARFAIEQLIRTAQGIYGRGKVPVRVLLDGNESDLVLGVPTAEPVTGSPDGDVLAPVSLSEPSEGLVMHVDDFITVDGRAVSADGRVSLQVKRWEGTAALTSGRFNLVPSDGTLAPFSVDFGVDDLQPGDYNVTATVTNADGTVDSDTRRITIVD